jgi:preprotein translocase subunit YajC
VIAPTLLPLATTLAATTTKSKGSSFGILVFIIPIAALFFFMSRQNKKKTKAAHALQTELSLGATVITIGGLYGTVRSITDDDVELEVAPGVVSRYARRAVATVLPPEEPLDPTAHGLTDEPAETDDPPAQGTDEY